MTIVKFGILQYDYGYVLQYVCIILFHTFAVHLKPNDYVNIVPLL